jgi:hypothetical protein
MYGSFLEGKTVKFPFVDMVGAELIRSFPFVDMVGAGQPPDCPLELVLKTRLTLQARIYAKTQGFLGYDYPRMLLN